MQAAGDLYLWRTPRRAHTTHDEHAHPVPVPTPSTQRQAHRHTRARDARCLPSLVLPFFALKTPSKLLRERGRGLGGADSGVRRASARTQQPAGSQAGQRGCFCARAFGFWGGIGTLFFIDSALSAKRPSAGDHNCRTQTMKRCQR
eukprot:scaffold4145_cov115-Isochrysis_galbana.AAC.2